MKKMELDYRKIVVHFRLRIISDNEVLQILQVDGVPEKIRREFLKILKEDRKKFILNPRNGDEIIFETISRLENLLLKVIRKLVK